MVFLLLLLNFVISWSNARVVGQYWTESKNVGGSFRAYIVCGYAMAIAGFTMVYTCVALMLAPPILQARGVSPEIIERVLQLSSDILYLLYGGVIVCSGMRIWATTFGLAWKNRSLRYVATAGWNTYAQLSNTIRFARTAPSAFGRVMEALFGGKKSRSKSSSSKKGDALVIYLAIIIVMIALFGGYFTADAIMKRADADYDAYAETYKRYGQAQTANG